MAYTQDDGRRTWLTLEKGEIEDMRKRREAGESIESLRKSFKISPHYIKVYCGEAPWPRF
jgi:hypothetical protein